jgi:hypothetical protein
MYVFESQIEGFLEQAARNAQPAAVACYLPFFFPSKRLLSSQ